MEEMLGVSRATLKRTIQDMRDYLNAPIEYSRERNGYYYQTVVGGGRLDDLFGVAGIEIPNRAGELLIQSIVFPERDDSEGVLVENTSIVWFEILSEIRKDSEFLYRFTKNGRAFEEFIAGAYVRAGWPEVILTPRSGDKGRDVIATKPGLGSIRILDQVKAYSPGHLVTHDDVRSMLGVLQVDSNASKGIITTTSDFQPSIYKGDEFSKFIPYRLELKNGVSLRQWLLNLHPH